MAPRVRLSCDYGQFWDRELGFHLRQGEVKELPDPLPGHSATAARLRCGGLVICDPPQEAFAFEAPLKCMPDLSGPEAPEVEAPVVKPKPAPRRKRTAKAAR